MKNAVLLPYLFDKTDENWTKRLKWICDALREEGYEIFKLESFHANINAKDCIRVPKDALHNRFVEAAGPRSESFSADIIIYNHTDLPTVKARNLPLDAEHVWFFKPTVPDQSTTTLDELGYASYSSITYDKPPYEKCSPVEVSKFYQDTVSNWMANNDSKWGRDHFKQIDPPPHDDFYLIIGQCGGDSVVTYQDFGGYFEKMESIIKELIVQDRDREVVVKLHPYTNGPMHNPNQCNLIVPLTEKYEKISPRVKVYSDFSSIHSFLPQARCVFIGNSGAGFEAMMNDTPIVSFCQPEYHWITYDLRKICDIHNAIELDWFDLDSQRKFLYWYMEKYCFYDYDSAKRRVSDLLEEEIEYRVRFL